MGDRKHLLHVKSNVAETTKQYGINDFLVTPKKPVDPTTGKATNDTLLYGEIAVNYGKGVEALTIRNTEDNVVAFVNENDFHEAGEIAADGLATEKLEREEAFNYLDNKIDTSAVSEMVSITYADIKVLREQSKLKAGQFYRITDYVTTTTQENTQSAGHVFDVIVIATDVDTLNENAKVIKHEGDTYFADSNLDAWEIKYDLDNDTTKYAWADATNGKGVIYYMKDEFNNECPYDFKNIQFKRYKLNNQSGLHFADSPLKEPKYQYLIQQVFTNWYDILDTSMKTDNVSFYYTKNIDHLVSGADIYTSNRSDYKYYDRGTLVFNENSGGSYVALCAVKGLFDIIAEVEDTNGEWFYTFSKKTTATDAAVDASLSKLTNIECYSNSIKEYINDEQHYYLNDNIFIVLGSVGYIYSNNFNIDCYYNTFGNSCNGNTFGSSCYSNTFGSSCYSNTFGNDCENNMFGEGCQSNTFGNNCESNAFGFRCNWNTFGNYCIGNPFGNYCQYNTFGNYCSSNTFVTSCLKNTFGNYCSSNTFGDSCNGNTFGNDCESNTFGKSCESNKFGNSCESNKFGNSCSSNTFGIGCSTNTFGDNCKSNKFGNSCSNNTFVNGCTDNTFGGNCTGNKFNGIGCTDNTFGITCIDNTFGITCIDNTFGGSCSNNTFVSNCIGNTFGEGCQSNTFGNYCNYNTFGGSCQNNEFGGSCENNEFGDSCSNNTFGSSCSSNTFGITCIDNTFGNSCQSNKFGNSCSTNTFGITCIDNTFGGSCQNNKFGNNCDGNTFGNYCQHNVFEKDYMVYNIVENGNKYITVTSDQTTTSRLKLRNFTIAQGVNNTTTVKTIKHNTVNDIFKTTYQSANSHTVNV